MKLFSSSPYLQSELTAEMLAENPFSQFKTWYEEAEKANMELANAMSLATANKAGIPSVRTVLLKYFDEDGFVFFTNYNSPKALDIKENPNVSILFPWLTLERQIRISGRVEKVSTATSLNYFISRPKGSQIGAWCSNQSSVISSRKLLLQKVEEMKNKFQNGDIPIPDFWGGYRIIPETFEFWQGRKNRLHDRFQYSKTDKQWVINRLAP